MVQFNLPQNSKIEVGRHYKDITNSNNLKKVNVYRWDPSTGQNPRVDTFEVDMDNCGPKVLDILFKIKNEICLLYTSPSPRDRTRSRMPSSA